MLLAVVIDATDGALARTARVKDHIPWFDGALLDNIVDYTTYVLVPVYFIYRAELLPPQDGWWLAPLPLLASAYGFCQKEAKTSDHFFQGFPSYWNVVAFYCYAFKTPPWISGFAIIALSISVFVPIRYLYPSRSPTQRSLVNTLGMLWAVLLAIILHQLPEPSHILLIASLLFPAYYTALSLWLEWHRAVD